MRHRSRTVRALKWVGTLVSVLLLTLSLVSLSWSVKYVHSKQVEDEWHELEYVPFLIVNSKDADEWPCVSGIVILERASITVFWEHDSSADSLRLAAQPRWSVKRRRSPPKLTSSPATGNWWKWVEWSDFIGLPCYRILTIRFWPPLLAITALTMILWWLDRRRIPPGHCQRCGYDLTGNVSGRCPECGQAIASDAEARDANG